jgi:peptidoglycan hydrolase-like protein with peptidoglycan-binding domain
MTRIDKVFDDVNVGLIPGDAEAAAGYVDGHFQTFPALVRRFGNRIPLVSITVFGNHARIVDIEPGNPLTDKQAADWTAAMIRDGVYRPGPYTSASNVDAVAAELSRAGVRRSQSVIWSAHYTGVPHICGPNSCGACRTQCDATQYTNKARGQNLDETLAEDYFLKAGSVPTGGNGWTEKMLQDLPNCSDGQSGRPDCSQDHAFRIQGLLVGVGKLRGLSKPSSVVIDGNFGPATRDGVIAVQADYGLTRDGVVGPETWTRLVAY